MQYNQDDNVVFTIKQKRVSVLNPAPDSNAATAAPQLHNGQLTWKDKAGLFFVVFVLLMLQLLSRLKLLK